MRLEYGQPIYLQQLEQFETSRQQVKLIGWETGKSLIVRPPNISNWVLVLPSNIDYAARLFAGGSAFAFKTSVLCIHHDPFDYFHLTYPNDIESSRVRNSPRVTIDMVASVMTEDQKQMDNRVHNMSQTGMGIIGPANLANVNDRLQMNFDITVAEQTYSFSETVVVRNIRPFVGNSTQKYFGAEFVTLSQEKAVIVSGFLYEQG